jgi:hypothetical protein
MLQPAAWAHSSSPLYHLARVLSASNNISEVLALSHCINSGPRKSQISTRCRTLLLRRFNGFLCYQKQLPSETNALPTIHIVSPTVRACSCTIVTQIRPVPHDPGLSTPFYDATLHIHISLPIPHGLCSSLCSVQQTGYDQSPLVAHGRPPLFSVPR